MNRVSALAVFGLILLSSCSKEKDKKPTFKAAAKVALDNATQGAALLDGIPMTTFEMKLVRVYVSEDINAATGANSGQTFMVYMNPECLDEKASCDISGATYNVTKYFDLARPSAEVNADLNSQNRTIEFFATENSLDGGEPIPESVTLRYARIELSGANPDSAKNVKWATTNIAERELLWGGTSTTKLTTPIVIKAGDTVTFKLSYDYAEAVRTVQDKPADADCVASTTDSSMFDCFFMPTFVSSATKG